MNEALRKFRDQKQFERFVLDKRFWFGTKPNNNPLCGWAEECGMPESTVFERTLETKGGANHPLTSWQIQYLTIWFRKFNQRTLPPHCAKDVWALTKQYFEFISQQAAKRHSKKPWRAPATARTPNHATAS